MPAYPIFVTLVPTIPKQGDRMSSILALTRDRRLNAAGLSLMDGERVWSENTHCWPDSYVFILYVGLTAWLVAYGQAERGLWEFQVLLWQGASVTADSLVTVSSFTFVVWVVVCGVKITACSQLLCWCYLLWIRLRDCINTDTGVRSDVFVPCRYYFRREIKLTLCGVSLCGEHWLAE